MADEKGSPEVGEEPPALTRGYNQTYIIRKPTEEQAEAKFAGTKEEEVAGAADRDVFFRCGNWCYAGSVYLGHDDMTLRDMPRIIPLLQRQQSKLSYTCNATRVPAHSPYKEPMEHIHAATEFVARQLCTERTSRDIQNWAEVFPWIEDETQPTYFELCSGEVPPALRNVGAMASKTYARGLVLITIYFEGSYFVVVKDGSGDQPLLDVRFPDVSQHGQGLSITLDRGVSNLDAEDFTKLTLWQSLGQDIRPLMPSKRNPNEVQDISSSKYMQTYCVLKNDTETSSGAPSDPAMRKAMFRFGSWCYAGEVQLIQQLSLPDIPHVIPALRAQQARLQFRYDVSQMPRNDIYTEPLTKMLQLCGLMTDVVAGAEDVLASLLERMSSMGLADTVGSWLDGESKNSFFEFSFARDGEMERAFQCVDVIASKIYDARGFIIVTVLYQDAVYLVIMEGNAEQPLLDSSFPDVSKKGRGYQIHAFPDGHEEWPELRKVSIWQTAEAMQDDMDRAMAKAEEMRATMGNDAADAAAAADAKRAELVETEFLRADGKYVDSPRAHRSLGPDSHGAVGADAGAGAKAPAKVATRTMAKPSKGTAKVVEADSLRTSQSKIALPHHLPGNEGLSAKLEEIRKKMGGGDITQTAPWDRTGRPLGRLNERK